MKRILRRRAGPLICLIVADLLMFSMTDATKVPSFMVIIGFGLLTLTIYQLIYGLLGLTSLYGITVKRKRVVAVYVTIIAGLVIALQSIGELGSRDVLVLLPLALIGYFYSAYAKSLGRDLGS